MQNFPKEGEGLHLQVGLAAMLSIANPLAELSVLELSKNSITA